MGILKSISSGIKKAERKYHKLEKESRLIRKKVGQAIDYIAPPEPKKSKKGMCSCPCGTKKKKKR